MQMNSEALILDGSAAAQVILSDNHIKSTPASPSRMDKAFNVYAERKVYKQS